MKISENWLREWVDPDLAADALLERLTLAGLEVDGAEPLGAALDGIVVGEVIEVAQHPDADRLSVCQVSDGRSRVQVVCGAPNVRPGLRSPLALPGTRLPNGVKLRKTRLRGVESAGMLCSVAELDLGEESDGIMELAESAPAGQPLAELLGLPDTVIDIDLTPNRGDCFSVLGVAREVATFTGAPLRDPAVAAVEDRCDARHEIRVLDTTACPRFVGRVVRGIDASAKTPFWMREKLRRGGVRAIHPVVDVTNYILLEYGQPLHGYDLRRLSGALQVRLADEGEQLVLLDGREVALNGDVLVIADDSGPIGLAGIMGGLSTAVSAETVDVLLEGAFFAPAAVAGRSRRFGLHTDASMRFERGVDPAHQRRAIELATALLVEIAGGRPGPVVEVVDEQSLPAREPVALRRGRLAAVLGVELADGHVEGILERLGNRVEPGSDGWNVTPPSHRFDILIEEDLIEEVARVHGYDEIPEIRTRGAVALPVVTETVIGAPRIRSLMVDRGYHEVLTYSFVDPDRQRAVLGEVGRLALANPISSELSVMRGSLLPGLLEALERNVSRQHARVRLFELGVCFSGDEESIGERMMLAAVACGPVRPEQWSDAGDTVDFFDIKSDLHAVAGLAGAAADLRYSAATHPAMHPGQCARIERDGRELGIIGSIHPALARRLDVPAGLVMFEVDYAGAFAANVPVSAPISRYPSVRRDIAVLLPETVAAGDIMEAVRRAQPAYLKDIRVFDVYRGKGIEAGLKSVALGLILQETSRTLTDDEADAVVRSAVQALENDFGARLRD